VVGARRATEYGHEVAGALGRGLGSAGVTVVSGMAIGIDAAAHTGTLDAGGTGIAVVPSSVDRPYPADARRLARAIGRTGAVVSELPPAVSARRWMFPARNRIIAALAAMTVVVEAAGRSGSLVTARVARDLGRIVGAVPGRVTTSQAEGPNALISQGATVVRSTIDVLEALYGGGGGIELPVRAPPPPEQRELLAAIAGGADTESGLAAAGFRLREVLAGVAALELSGHVRRGGGGRFVVIP
jgi:DNA processing protein